ncbi:hypothetical protein JZ751_022029, partial [Albula glossodonta]
MSVSCRLALLAVAFLIIGCVSLASGDYRRPTKVTTRCCTSVSRSTIKLPIIGYTIQNALPPCVNATMSLMYCPPTDHPDTAGLLILASSPPPHHNNAPVCDADFPK